MGLFDIFKKKEVSIPEQPRILLSMPMFKDGEGYNLQDVLKELKSAGGLVVSDVSGDNSAATFMLNGNVIALGYVPAHIPCDDIEPTTAYAYNWPTAAADLKGHNAHAIVSVMDGDASTFERYIMLSKVLSAVLSTSNAVGIYQGGQSLLIPKSQYLDGMEELKQGRVPVALWIYFGVRQSPDGNSLYTYGLDGFGKQEMEIINSPMEMEDIYDFMQNICVYVVEQNITFKDGETVGYTEDQKIKITSSKGVFVEGQTLKLAM